MDLPPPLELLGWLAAGLLVAGFALTSVVPARLVSVAAAMLFAIWATINGKIFLAALGLAAIAVNLFRLAQLRQWDRRASAARSGDMSLDWIRSAMRPVTFGARELLFRKGDPPHYIYYIKSGQVLLEEIGVTLGPGEIVGEIAFFTDAHERTLTARCIEKSEIMVIRESDFVRLQRQNPAFGVYILRLVASRLLDGITHHPDAYRSYTILDRKRQSDEKDLPK